MQPNRTAWRGPGRPTDDGDLYSRMPSPPRKTTDSVLGRRPRADTGRGGDAHGLFAWSARYEPRIARPAHDGTMVGSRSEARPRHRDRPDRGGHEGEPGPELRRVPRRASRSGGRGASHDAPRCAAQRPRCAGHRRLGSATAPGFGQRSFLDRLTRCAGAASPVRITPGAAHGHDVEPRAGLRIEILHVRTGPRAAALRVFDEDRTTGSETRDGALDLHTVDYRTSTP